MDGIRGVSIADDSNTGWSQKCKARNNPGGGESELSGMSGRIDDMWSRGGRAELAVFGAVPRICQFTLKHCGAC
jgi:hypothetical protein